MRRLLLLGGVVGPTAFVGAWLTGGLLRDGYRPTVDTISRLAEQGVPTQPLMTAGFVAFGVLVPLFATQVDSRALKVAATTSGLATLAVACTPLSRDGGTTVDSLHYVSALVGYVGQAASPWAGASLLPRPALSRALSVACATALVASIVDAEHAGLWQRLGLTLVDAWFVVLAVRLLRR